MDRMLVVLAALACAANALRTKGGEAAPQTALPFAVPSLSSAMKQQKTAVDTLGPVAWETNTVGVRLPDDSPSPAWGADKFKTLNSDGLTGKDFVAGRLFSGGTDGKTQAHGLAAAGLVGKDKLGRPDVHGIMAAASADQDGVYAVAAVPRQDPDGRLGLDYARTKATMKKGHILPGQLLTTQHGAALNVEKDRAKVSTGAASAQHRASGAVSMEEDFNDYQVKLMTLDFPYQIALWFATMRGWCNHPEHGLPAAEEAQKVRALEGQYKVLKDNESPENVGKVMTIKDGKLFYRGVRVLNTAFKAYVDHKYSSVTPLVFPADNSTVELHKIFTVNGNRLEFEGGNFWERQQAQQAPAAPAQSKGVDWLQKLLSAGRK